MPGARLSAYIVTLRLKPGSAPEGYYVMAISPEHAKVRAFRLAKNKKAEVLDVLAA